MHDRLEINSPISRLNDNFCKSRRITEGLRKSWLACAFGNAACRHGLTVRYERTSRLLEELRIARTDGSYKKAFRALARLDLLILDDFGLKPMSQAERHDLLNNSNHGRRHSWSARSWR